MLRNLQSKRVGGDGSVAGNYLWEVDRFLFYTLVILLYDSWLYF